MLVEKILEGDEPLPDDWATAGTTGYDALGDFDRVLIDPAGEGPLGLLAARLEGPTDWKALIHTTKREVADGILHSEVLRLVRDAAAEVDERAVRGRDRRAADLLPRLPHLPPPRRRGAGRRGRRGEAAAARPR